MNKYIVGGIVLGSEIEFPELIKEKDREIDVLVKYGEIPEKLEGGSDNHVLFSHNQNDQVILEIPEIARYLVNNTKEIIIHLIDEKKAEDAHKYILTFVLGVISFKKGFFPLHGGGIVHNGEAYMFTGKSGAGKSTTLAGLQQRGFSSVGDDISNLFFREGKTHVHPCFPRFKLWDESLEILNLRNSGEYKLRSDMEKFLVPMNNFHSTPVPVKRIYHLVEENSAMSFNLISKNNKIKKLIQNSYKPWMVKTFKLQQKHFNLVTQITDSVEITEFTRPKDQKKLDQMFDFLIQNIKGE